MEVQRHRSEYAFTNSACASATNACDCETVRFVNTVNTHFE